MCICGNFTGHHVHLNIEVLKLILVHLFRMSVECYMTRGQFLSIGQLACTMCKAKTLKGLDFSNSYILPESGHPLHQPSVEIIPIKNELVETVPEVTLSKPREIILHREVVLPSSPTSQGRKYLKSQL